MSFFFLINVDALNALRLRDLQNVLSNKGKQVAKLLPNSLPFVEKEGEEWKLQVYLPA